MQLWRTIRRGEDITKEGRELDTAEKRSMKKPRRGPPKIKPRH